MQAKRKQMQANLHTKPSKINHFQTKSMKTTKNPAKCKQNESKCKEIQTQKTKQNHPLPNKINDNQ